ncbi:MAG: NADH-quinone oxidoreductase subunit L [Proteobacteria bacterium]|nr:NADH-quinone oxidoreductase subunit L [Pseudomonadota bacterium]
MNLTQLVLIPLLPLIGAILAGLLGRVIGRVGAHTVTILAVAISCALSFHVLKQIYLDGVPAFDGPVYSWLVSDGVKFDVGFLIDRLSAMMMVVVTFVSLCVHVYTIGYMSDDPGYQRFFSYISLFTFSMLMLVMSNNFMQLFFGWEAVGVVSYLLIGFWYTRPSAIFANFKAFLVNRVGDFGFVLGIAGVFYFTNSISYADAFAAAPKIAAAMLPLTSNTSVHAMTLICICLFIGAMGKSAQVPLHVWLPDSMEGPTPISALIHAATMVTAGIFMVSRMSPLFEQSDAALSFVLVIGATTAFFMGLLGIVNNDIKRVIAYSTLSQLGYMVTALGVSAYSAGMFHLMTHAFFKALLFLAAGSVIIGMHHEQDMRKMGGLAKYMPITAITSWIGSLALIGTPFFAGFYSKDTIIEAVGESHRWGATYAYWCVLAGVFVTALYSFRLVFMTFHGPERFRQVEAGHGHETAVTPAAPAVSAAAGVHASHGADSHAAADAHGAHAHDAHTPAAAAHAHGAHDAHAPAAHAHDDHAHDDHGHHGPVEPHESPLVVTGPLIALAIPSLLIGFLTVGPVLFGGYFGDSIRVLEQNDVVAELGKDFQSPTQMALHAFAGAPFWLAAAGVFFAWLFFLKKPEWADTWARTLAPIRNLLLNKYYFDWFNEKILATLARGLGFTLWKAGDQVLIDGALVNGSAATVSWFGSIVRRVQSGYLYSYAFWMVIGLAVMLGWFLVR